MNIRFIQIRVIDVYVLSADGGGKKYSLKTKNINYK